MFTRIDPVVDFPWNGGSPAPGVPGTDFRVQWSGKVSPPYPGDYVFYTMSDDGVRLFIDGVQIINHWDDHIPTRDNSLVTYLTCGQHSIILQYFQGTGGSVIQLGWQNGNIGEVLPIPQQYLFPDAVTPEPTSTYVTPTPTRTNTPTPTPTHEPIPLAPSQDPYPVQYLYRRPTPLPPTNTPLPPTTTRTRRANTPLPTHTSHAEQYPRAHAYPLPYAIPRDPRTPRPRGRRAGFLQTRADARRYPRFLWVSRTVPADLARG